MATEADHISLANKNHQALDHLISQPDTFSEWITTIAFYKAVHIVEAVFSQDPKVNHCCNHGARHHCLSEDGRYRLIYKHYRPLWQASTIARYLVDNTSGIAYSTFSSYLPPDDVIAEIIKYRLRSIEIAAKPLLSPAAQSALLLV